MIPRLPRGEALINSAVGSEEEPLANRRFWRLVFVFRFGRFRRGRRARLKGKRMTIRMHLLGKILPKILPAFIGDEQGHAEHIDALIVRWIDPDLAEVKRARIDVAHPRPFLSAILGTENTTAPTVNIADVTRTAFVTLHDRHHQFWFAQGNGESYPTCKAGPTVSTFFPGRYAVGAFKGGPD